MAVRNPPSRPALRAKYDERRAHVIDCATRLFAERGFHATSMADLVEATGLAAGGLYHYIGSKDELLVAICDRLMAPLLEEAEAIVAAGGPADEQLRAVVRVWTAHVDANRDAMRVFQQERHVLERGAQWRDVRRQRKQFEELVAAILDRGAAEGTIDLPDPGLALRALLGMVNHTSQWLRPRGRLSAEQVADGYCDLLLR